MAEDTYAAYQGAYLSALREHAIRIAYPDTSTAVRAASRAASSRYSSITAARAAEEVIKDQTWSAAEWVLQCIVLVFVGTCALATAQWLLLLAFNLITATTVAAKALSKRYVLRERAKATAQAIDTLYIRLRYRPAVDTAYLNYQLTRNWIGRHKYHLILSAMMLCHFSTVLERLIDFEHEMLVDMTMVKGPIVPAMYWQHRSRHLCGSPVMDCGHMIMSRQL